MYIVIHTSTKLRAVLYVPVVPAVDVFTILEWY